MNFVLFGLVVISACVAHGHVNITKIEMCDPNFDYPVKFQVELKEENGMQIVEKGSMDQKVPLGDNINLNADVYIMENGKWDFLISLRDTFCSTVNKYLGDFAFDMQKAAGLEPGTCPIPAGNYAIAKHPLDFDKFKFRKVPQGQMQVKGHLIDPTTNQTLLCIDIEFTLVH